MILKKSENICLILICKSFNMKKIKFIHSYGENIVGEVCFKNTDKKQYCCIDLSNNTFDDFVERLYKLALKFNKQLKKNDFKKYCELKNNKYHCKYLLNMLKNIENNNDVNRKSDSLCANTILDFEDKLNLKINLFYVPTLEFVYSDNTSELKFCLNRKKTCKCELFNLDGRYINTYDFDPEWEFMDFIENYNSKL